LGLSLLPAVSRGTTSACISYSMDNAWLSLPAHVFCRRKLRGVSSGVSSINSLAIATPDKRTRAEVRSTTGARSTPGTSATADAAGYAAARSRGVGDSTVAGYLNAWLQTMFMRCMLRMCSDDMRQVLRFVGEPIRNACTCPNKMSGLQATRDEGNKT